jgi:CheY-like chemotaxis protein
MKILIVEDDANKLYNLKEFLRKAFPEIQLSFAGSYRGGLEGAIRSDSSLILLDMSLPTYEKSSNDEGEFLFFAGKEILRQMARRRIPTPVIVFTQFESFGKGAEKQSLPELTKELEDRYKANYRGTIYYNASIDSWKMRLEELIRQTIVPSENGGQ